MDGLVPQQVLTDRVHRTGAASHAQVHVLVGFTADPLVQIFPAAGVEEVVADGRRLISADRPVETDLLPEAVVALQAHRDGYRGAVRTVAAVVPIRRWRAIRQP